MARNKNTWKSQSKKSRPQSNNKRNKKKYNPNPNLPKAQSLAKRKTPLTFLVESN